MTNPQVIDQDRNDPDGVRVPNYAVGTRQRHATAALNVD